MKDESARKNTHPPVRRALVIGSGGGIASELLSRLLEDEAYDEVHSVSRTESLINHPKQYHHVLESSDGEAVSELCQHLKNDYGEFVLIICCIGQLHGGDQDKSFRPEKRLESLSSQTMLKYFEVNTIAPMNWLKHSVKLVVQHAPSHVVFFTARVASIEDNHLGGWYGYRSSKAALNMLIKTAQVEFARRAADAVLVSYHPGTVDTALSQPFQKNVPAEKLFSPEFTVTQLLSILPNLTPDNAPHYIDWQGNKIPW